MIGWRHIFAAIALGCGAGAAAAETVVANRVIASRTVLAPEDVRVDGGLAPGALTDPADAIGREAVITIYPGRPIRAGDLTEPAVVERNDVVRLRYSQMGLDIATDGRALERGAVGDRLRVMNLRSRAIVAGRVVAPGEVEVVR